MSGLVARLRAKVRLGRGDAGPRAAPASVGTEAARGRGASGRHYRRSGGWGGGWCGVGGGVPAAPRPERERGGGGGAGRAAHGPEGALHVGRVLARRDGTAVAAHLVDGGSVA